MLFSFQKQNDIFECVLPKDLNIRSFSKTML